FYNYVCFLLPFKYLFLQTYNKFSSYFFSKYCCFYGFFQMAYNVFVYGLLRGLARNLANKNRIENPRGFS
ncbi:hypothetical protein, partial [Tenacibaculum piscium]|uniref:hypothetical protein n=1 Tax=Tenacibaculum piscium TaxID=1458515 RepID=UPI001F1DF6A3